MSGIGKTVELRVRRAALNDVHRDLARLHGDHRPGIKSGRVMVLRVGDRAARVMARARLDEQERDDIALDDRLRERLEVDLGNAYRFSVRPGSVVDEILWAWKATDATTRVMAQLTVVSLGLGAVGLFLGFLSLFT